MSSLRTAKQVHAIQELEHIITEHPQLTVNIAVLVQCAAGAVAVATVAVAMACAAAGRCMWVMQVAFHQVVYVVPMFDLHNMHECLGKQRGWRQWRTIGCPQPGA